jgi:hypothetical protein
MSFFTQYQGSRLYTGSTAAGEAGWLAYLLPEGTSLPSGIDLEPALTQHPGSFLFSAKVPDLATAPALEAFVAAIDLVIARSPATRGFLWLMDPAAPTASGTPLMGIDSR